MHNSGLTWDSFLTSLTPPANSLRVSMMETVLRKGGWWWWTWWRGNWWCNCCREDGKWDLWGVIFEVAPRSKEGSDGWWEFEALLFELEPGMLLELLPSMDPKVIVGCWVVPRLGVEGYKDRPPESSILFSPDRRLHLHACKTSMKFYERKINNKHRIK